MFRILYFNETKWTFLIFIIFIISYSNSASITTFSSSTYHHIELISNSSYRYLFLRQYYIDLLNISHSSLIQSMIKTHHLIPKLEQSLYFDHDWIIFILIRISLLVKYRRRREMSLIPISTIHSTNCLQINIQQIQTTFQWSYSIESLSSIELIYHIDSKISFIPIEISIKHSQTLNELFSIKSNLQYDSNRDFYSIDLYDYLLRLNNRNNLILQIILSNQTCQTSHGYVIILSKRLSSNDSQLITKCRLKTMEINFEELGLADLIIRPKEYSFTYCDGSCSNIIPQQQSSFRTFLQSILSQKHSNIPQLNCHPSEYSDDNFLLRQTDGNMEIYPIKNAIVKQCACL